MNISFFDGVNDGKFYSINAGKYDELGEEDIDISTEVEEEEEDDADTCLNRFAALEKDASKLHMDLNNLRNEFIAELRTMMDKVNDRVNKRLKLISEATTELDDKLNDKLSLVEKKLEVFKCIDILDRVTKLEEQVKPTILEETKKLEVRPSVADDILDRVAKLEKRCDTDDKLIGSLGRHIVDTDCNLSSLSDRVSKLDSKLIITAKIVDTINGTTSGYGHDYVIIADRINELESKLKILEDTKCDKVSPSVADDIQDDPVNHPKHYTDGKYECIDFIHQYGLGFDLGNAVKYITRAGIKSEDTYIQDLEKALWYLEHHIKDPINPVIFSKPNMIPVDDYCHDKMLTDELTRVIEDIVNDNIGTAAWILTKYIQGLKNEQSK